MKFADKVIFFQKRASHYDTTLGERVDDGEAKTERWAHVTTPSLALAQYAVTTTSRTSRMGTVPGDAKIDQIIVHLKQPFADDFDHMEWQGQSYFFVSQSRKGMRQVILMKGDHHGTDTGNKP